MYLIGEVVEELVVLGLLFMGVQKTVVLEAVFEGVREGGLAEMGFGHIDIALELLDLRENDAFPTLEEVQLFVQMGGLLEVLDDEFVLFDQFELLLVFPLNFLSQGEQLLFEDFVFLLFKHVEVVVMILNRGESLLLISALKSLSH